MAGFLAVRDCQVIAQSMKLQHSSAMANGTPSLHTMTNQKKNGGNSMMMELLM